MLSGTAMRNLRSIRQKKNSMAVGVRIKAARNSLDIRQGVMANRLGVSRASLSQWENGEISKPIPFEVVQDIAAITGTDAFYLMFGDAKRGQDITSEIDGPLHFRVTGSLVLTKAQTISSASTSS